MSILVVEPNPILQNLISEQLKVLDQHVFFVERAEQAAELMETIRFHFLIVEPKPEGQVDWIAALPYKPPILLLSSLPKERLGALARQVGAVFMQKPYSLHRFIDVVILLLAESRRGVRHGGTLAAAVL